MFVLLLDHGVLLAAIGRSLCGPVQVVPRVWSVVPWQVVQSVMVPLWPCNWVAVTLSLAFGLAFSHSAWVAPWQASHITPLWPSSPR